MDIKEKFMNIIDMVNKIEITDYEDSIFSSKYMLTPNDIAYIFILASQEIGFQITEDFIDMLEEKNSFSDIIDYISAII